MLALTANAGTTGKKLWSCALGSPTTSCALQVALIVDLEALFLKKCTYFHICFNYF